MPSPISCVSVTSFPYFLPGIFLTRCFQHLIVLLLIIIGNSRGVAILFNNNFEFKVKDIHKGDRGNYIILTVRIKEIDILLVNLYGPNRDEPEFYNTLKEKIMKLDNPNVIMAGDWNMVLDTFKDYQNYKHVNNPKAREVVESMITDLNLCDTWRDLNPDCQRYTWRRTVPFQQARLVFFLVTD